MTRNYELRRQVEKHYERYVAERAKTHSAHEQNLKARGASSLLRRLQAAHPCPRTTGPRFVQTPSPISNGVRTWTCAGCGAIVHLDAKGAA